MPNRRGKHTFKVGTRGRYGLSPYIGYGYTSASHVPGHMKNRYGKSIYVSPGYTRTSGYYGRYNKIGSELKFKDSTLNDATIATTGTVQVSAVLIAQGTKENERLGRKCVVRSLYATFDICIALQVGGINGTKGDSVRIMIMLDKQANGAVPAVLDILETAQFMSYRNLANSLRFRTLSDKMYTLQRHATENGDVSGQAVDNLETTRIVKISIPKLNIPLEFNATTGAITEIRSNNIIFLYISKNGIAGIENRTRIRFTG